MTIIISNNKSAAKSRPASVQLVTDRSFQAKPVPKFKVVPWERTLVRLKVHDHMITCTQIHKYTNTQIHKYTNTHPWESTLLFGLIGPHHRTCNSHCTPHTFQHSHVANFASCTPRVRWSLLASCQAGCPQLHVDHLPKWPPP